MRYDVETALSGLLVAYLGDLMDPALACVPPATTAPCLIVDFTDPMSIDEANRIIVQVPTAKTTARMAGTWSARANVIARSRWTQATLKRDYAAHAERVNELRDKLCPADMVDRMAAYQPPGMTIVSVDPAREYSTRVFTNFWIESEAGFTVGGSFSHQP